MITDKEKDRLLELCLKTIEATLEAEYIYYGISDKEADELEYLTNKYLT